MSFSQVGLHFAVVFGQNAALGGALFEHAGQIMHFAVQIGFPGGVVGDFNAAGRIMRVLKAFFMTAFGDKIAGGQIDGGRIG